MNIDPTKITIENGGWEGCAYLLRAKNGKGKTAETSNPIVGKQVILKTEKKKEVEIEACY